MPGAADPVGCWQRCAPDGVATLKCLECIFMALFNIAIRLAGVALLIMLVWGGFKYLTAGADAKKAEAAKNTLTYAIAGLVLIIIGWFILSFISEFTGIEKIIKFEIPTP